MLKGSLKKDIGRDDSFVTVATISTLVKRIANREISHLQCAFPSSLNFNEVLEKVSTVNISSTLIVSPKGRLK